MTITARMDCTTLTVVRRPTLSATTWRRSGSSALPWIAWEVVKSNVDVAEQFVNLIAEGLAYVQAVADARARGIQVITLGIGDPDLMPPDSFTAPATVLPMQIVSLAPSIYAGYIAMGVFFGLFFEDLFLFWLVKKIS